METFSAPQVTVLSQLPEKDKPKVVLLDNAPKPVTTKVPSIYRSTMELSEDATGVKQKLHFSHRQTNFLINDTTGKPIVKDAQGKGFFATYTTDDGLALDQVYCSYKDKWGNLWFGTNGGGVSKYDGKSFTTYSSAQGLASNIIWCITQDHAGNLWFGTDGSGVSKFNGESFTIYTTV